MKKLINNTILTDLMEQISKTLLKQKEDLIKSTINHTLGVGKWNLEEIRHRCIFTILPDKSEIFSIDGKELLIFKGIVITHGIGANQATTVVTMPFKELYHG